jgi:hypothetical protein
LSCDLQTPFGGDRNLGLASQFVRQQAAGSLDFGDGGLQFGRGCDCRPVTSRFGPFQFA